MGEYICKYCGEILNTIRDLDKHFDDCPNNPNLQEINNLSKEQLRLLSHYKFLYPVESKQIKDNLVNKFKSQGYITLNANRKSNSILLEKLIEIDEPNQIKDGTWACPICNLHIKDMGAHVKSVHNLNWEDFTSNYNWTEPKIYFSEDYRNNLRDNKLNFYYNTDEGKTWRDSLGERVSGKNNPACRDDVKMKISKSRVGQHLSVKNRANISKSTTGGLYSENAKSFGYIFWARCKGKERRFRSKTEYLIFLMLEYYNIDYDYEPFKIEYYDPDCEYLRHYIVDFVINNRLFEVKPKEIDFSKDKKYKLIQNQLSKLNKTLEVITPQNFTDMLGINQIKPLSYFESLILDNIKNGECKIQLPLIHEEDFYYKSNYMKKLGDNPKEIILKGAQLYENKKGNRNN